MTYDGLIVIFPYTEPSTVTREILYICGYQVFCDTENLSTKVFITFPNCLKPASVEPVRRIHSSKIISSQIEYFKIRNT